MNLRWCAFTGALMLLSAGYTFLHMEVVKDPPGVATRWWDGTKKTADSFYSNGKPQAHTEFGDDGKTVNAHVEWSFTGAVVFSKIRLKDGRLEEKRFSDDGKTLLQYTLGTIQSDTSFVVQRVFHPNGKLYIEELRTADGAIATDMRVFKEDGTLEQESHILPNADNESRSYSNGVLSRIDVMHGTGDREVTLFYANGKKQRHEKFVKLDGSQVLELYTLDGSLRFRRELIGNDSTSVVSVFGKDGLVFKQFLNPAQRLTGVVEFSPSTGLPTRKLSIDRDGAVELVERYRPDGSLDVVKVMRRGKVVRQHVYNSAGVIVETLNGGDPEQIDRILLTDATRTFSNGSD